MPGSESVAWGGQCWDGWDASRNIKSEILMRASHVKHSNPVIVSIDPGALLGHTVGGES